MKHTTGYIQDQEDQLQDDYREIWDSVNVYAKHIGKSVEDKPRDCFVIFQIDRMSREIIHHTHILL